MTPMHSSHQDIIEILSDKLVELIDTERNYLRINDLLRGK